MTKGLDVNIHLHLHFPEAIRIKCDPGSSNQVPTWALQLHDKLDLILLEEETIMAALDDLTAQVAANSVAIDSAIVLINGIADRIAAAGVDPVALAALVTELRDKDAALATAVQANTPPVV